MHFYTEAPITSFFPRISASKKRKIHKELTPSGSDSNKRQRNIPRQGIESKAKGDKQEHRNSLDNETITILHSPSVEDLATARPAKSTLQQTSERHVQSLYAKDATPQTPKPNVLPSRKKLKTSLQTPPPTNAEAERQRLMDLTPTLSPFISRKSSVLRTEKALLPTSTSHYIRYSGRDHCRVFELSHQDLSSPTPPQHSNTSSKASVPVSIPSSQSQLMANGYFEDEHDLTPASTALVCIRPQLSRTDEDSTSHANQMVVCSSQSQFLSPVDGSVSPRRSHPSSIASNSELDIIPSSQSQENEVRILSDPEAFHQSISSRKQTLPQRTLSEELFSVSIPQTSWSVGSLDSEHSIKGITDIPCAANHGDDSATESEPEAEGKASYQGRPVNPMQSQPYGFSGSSAGDLASLNEDSQRIVSCYSQQSSLDLSLAEQTSSIASLPGVVKEFQSMFGSEDESYPPDFPMSLR